MLGSKLKKRIAVNGFGRIGRLAVRLAHAFDDLEVVHVNEMAGDLEMAAHLLEFDSVHGRWDVPVGVAEGALNVAGRSISGFSNQRLQDTRWSELGLDVVVDCTGKFKSIEALQPYLEQGVNNVVVSAPISDDVLNVVVGVNDEQYNPKQHRLVTAASCTTNCIAPVISVLHQQFSIEHGSITTIHDITNTQSVLDSSTRTHVALAPVGCRLFLPQRARLRRLPMSSRNSRESSMVSLYGFPLLMRRSRIACLR